MTVRLVIRVLDKANELLAWTETEALMKGDAKLRSQGPMIFAPLKSGEATMISIHWPDLNVQTRVPWNGEPLISTMGVPFSFDWPDGVIIDFPTDDTPMPPVIVGKREINVPPSRVQFIAPLMSR